MFLYKRFCDCGFEIKEKEGIYVLATEKDFDLDKEDILYVSYSHIAKYYDKTRGGDSEIYLKAAEFIYTRYLQPDSVILDLGAGTGILGFHIAKMGTNLETGVRLESVIYD